MKSRLARQSSVAFMVAIGSTSLWASNNCLDLATNAEIARCSERMQGARRAAKKTPTSATTHASPARTTSSDDQRNSSAAKTAPRTQGPNVGELSPSRTTSDDDAAYQKRLEQWTQETQAANERASAAAARAAEDRPVMEQRMREAQEVNARIKGMADEIDAKHRAAAIARQQQILAEQEQQRQHQEWLRQQQEQQRQQMMLHELQQLRQEATAARQAAEEAAARAQSGRRAVICNPNGIGGMVCN